MFSQISYIIISDPPVLAVELDPIKCQVQKEAWVYMPSTSFE